MDPADKRVFQQWAGRPDVADFLKLGLDDSTGASIPGSRWSLAGVNAADVAEKVGLKRTQQIEILLAEDSSTLRQILGVLGPALDFNPRRVKQFTNIFRLRALIAAETGTFEARVSDSPDVSLLTLQQLAKFVVIGQKWPLFLAAVSEDQGLLGWVQREACDLANPTGQISPVNSYWRDRSDLRNALRLGCCGSESAEDDRPDLWSLADVNIDRILRVSGQVRRLVTQDVSVITPAITEPGEQETEEPDEQQVDQPNVVQEEDPLAQPEFQQQEVPNIQQQERPVVMEQEEFDLEPITSNQEGINLAQTVEQSQSQTSSVEAPIPLVTTPDDLRRKLSFHQQMEAYLTGSNAAFRNQLPVQNQLVDLMQKNRPDMESYQSVEELFLRYGTQLNDEERRLCDSSRQLTDEISRHNRGMLNHLGANPQYAAELPSSRQLSDHLEVWLKKFESDFVGNDGVCLVYVGVEEGQPFPVQIDAEVRSQVELLTRAMENPA